MASIVRIVTMPTRATAATTELDTGYPSTGSGWQAKDMQVVSDRQGQALAVLFDDSPAGRQIIQRDLVPVANTAVTKRLFFPSAVRLKTLALYVTTKPASVGGSVLFTATKNGATNVLSAASVSTKALTDATYTVVDLTATVANREFAAGDFLALVHTSNNVDMTAGTGFEVVAEIEFI